MHKPKIVLIYVCFVSESLKQAVGYQAIKLLVNVDEDDYERGRLKLLQNLRDWPITTADSSCSRICETDQSPDAEIGPITAQQTSYLDRTVASVFDRFHFFVFFVLAWNGYFIILTLCGHFFIPATKYMYSHIEGMWGGAADLSLIQMRWESRDKSHF